MLTKLSPKDDELLTKTAELVFAEVHRDAPVAHLPPRRQVFVRIYTAQGIIDNGSLPYFFGSDFPDAADYSAFRRRIGRLGQMMLLVGLTQPLGCFRVPSRIWIPRSGSVTFKSIAQITRARCVSLATASLRRVTGSFHFWQIMLRSIQMISQRSNKSLQPMPVGRLSSAFAVDIRHPAWLSSRRWAATCL